MASTTSGGRTRRLYSASFKAELVEQCRQVGVSSAAVAVSHGMNPNVLRRWVKESESSAGLAPKVRKAMTIDDRSGFVALAMEPLRQQQAVTSDGGIRIELQRNGITVSVTWAASRLADSAAWVREVLR
jgi:transposase